MTEIQKKLFSMADEAYAAFQAKLTPSVAPERFIGVRVPQLRQFAKTLGQSEREAFLQALPHTYYDENLLHSVLLEKEKDFALCLERVEAFLPFIDNWAVCDTLRPDVFRKHRAELLPLIEAWIASPLTYTCRFGLDMLMTHFLDEAFEPRQLALPLRVRNDDYYVRMMAAWYYATALTKQWAHTLVWLEERRLPAWIHGKTIQKACESRCLTAEQKQYLKTLRQTPAP